MKNAIILSLALAAAPAALFAASVTAPRDTSPAATAHDADGHLARMQEQVQRMQQEVARMREASDPQARQQAMSDHMQTMHAHMQSMHAMRMAMTGGAPAAGSSQHGGMMGGQHGMMGGMMHGAGQQDMMAQCMAMMQQPQSPAPGGKR